jgi:hypothetical protein
MCGVGKQTRITFFEFHGGTHGARCVYVNDVKSPSGKNVSCIWLQGAKQFQWRGEASIKDSDDAKAVVRANQALFLRFYKAYNS